MDIGEILNCFGSLCRMSPNLTTHAYQYLYFSSFLVELAVGFGLLS